MNAWKNCVENCGQNNSNDKEKAIECFCTGGRCGMSEAVNACQGDGSAGWALVGNLFNIFKDQINERCASGKLP